LRGFRLVCSALGIVTALAGIVIFAREARAEAEVYYNIVSVTSEQLNNAVRIRVGGDGVISSNVWDWWGAAEQGNYYLNWELAAKQATTWQPPWYRSSYTIADIWPPECYQKVDKILVHLRSARTLVGSIINVAKYPVSHVRLLTIREKSGGFGLDMEVVLYRPMRFRRFQLTGLRTWDACADHHDPAWFEVVQGSDTRNLIITVASDRLPESRDRRKLADVPEEGRELRTDFSNGLLDIHARNVGLSDLLTAVSRASGKQMMATDTAANRVVTAELPRVTLEEFVERIAECYGLVLRGMGDCLIFSDIVEQTAASQASVATARIPVRWMKARVAANMLPNFLIDYLRLDEERNAVVVFGSKALADKVAVDLAKIDQPPATVSLKAVLIQASSTADLTRELALRYSGRGFEVSADGSLGELTYSEVGMLPSDFDVRLSALVEAEKAKVKAESTVTVTSGERGEVFAGLSKYIQLQRSAYDPTQVVEPVSAGVRLCATPWVGSDTVSMDVATEVTVVGEIDPKTHLPVINRRSAEGTFRIRPGETVMIGGLSQVQDEMTVRKIPIIGDLPLIGKLFRTKTKHRVASELTVLLTPTIVESNPGPGFTPAGSG
jgi:type IV pilus assembly protein PilQ